MLQKLYNKLKGSPPPGPIWRHRVHLLHHGSTPLNSPQTALSLRLFARGSLETTKARCPGGVQEHHVSRALVRHRARPQRLPAGALCGHIRSTRSFCHIHASYTPRHAIPKQRCYADGPCIFNLPKKARFAAEHGLYVDGDLAGSELDVSTLQHACHMLRSSGATHLLVIYDPCVPSDV